MPVPKPGKQTWNWNCLPAEFRESLSSWELLSHGFGGKPQAAWLCLITLHAPRPKEDVIRSEARWKARCHPATLTTANQPNSNRGALLGSGYCLGTWETASAAPMSSWLWCYTQITCTAALSLLEPGQLKFPFSVPPLPCPANDSSHAWVKKRQLFPFSPVTYSEEALHHLSPSQKTDLVSLQHPCSFHSLFLTLLTLLEENNIAFCLLLHLCHKKTT